jgi:error-prone DNA polymerase
LIWINRRISKGSNASSCRRKLFDRSSDLLDLANDTPRRKEAMPAALIEPLNDDRRDHLDNPAQKIRHPRNVRILPASRDFH